MSKPNLTSYQEENCKEAIKQHTYSLLSASQSYDKGILGLSTAALGYTFIYARYFGGYHSCLLSFTWFFLVLSILFVLVSFIFEQLHSEHRIKYYYYCLTGLGEPTDRKPKHWSDDEWMILPSLSGGCFLLGIILFVIFVENIK